MLRKSPRSTLQRIRTGTGGSGAIIPTDREQPRPGWAVGFRQSLRAARRRRLPGWAAGRLGGCVSLGGSREVCGVLALVVQGGRQVTVVQRVCCRWGKGQAARVLIN